MGRIKTAVIKKTGRRIVEENPKVFTADFEKNKKLVAKILDVDKKTRNLIAGFITKLIKKQEKG